MNTLKPLSLVLHKIAGNKVVISNEILTQLVGYINDQTKMITTLTMNLQKLTNTVNTLSTTEKGHYNETTKSITSVQKETNESLEKLQNQVSTLAKSI